MIALPSGGPARSDIYLLRPRRRRIIFTTSPPPPSSFCSRVVVVLVLRHRSRRAPTARRRTPSPVHVLVVIVVVVVVVVVESRTPVARRSLHALTLSRRTSVSVAAETVRAYRFINKLRIDKQPPPQPSSVYKSSSEDTPHTSFLTVLWVSAKPTGSLGKQP